MSDDTGKPDDGGNDQRKQDTRFQQGKSVSLKAGPESAQLPHRAQRGHDGIDRGA